MMCFKDKTFCQSDCTNSQCYRYYGPAEEAGAKRWGATFGRGENPPVAFSDFSGSCPDYRAALKGDDQ